ncbi:unnamed protein product [Schistosoma curassoni]|uniref:Uncharacterized protein n=1 Tax=Schistosoma curassoni TaxID=6186 RepID=A0A183JBV0_9TREM|nr:unnamed protein product [Schistosoma curassoni]
MQNTSNLFTRHYQQQPTVGEDKPDPSGGRSQEEALEVDRTHIEESTQLRHNASPHMESSRPKEERKTKEHITLKSGDRHEKNEQQLNRTRKDGLEHEWVGECWSVAYAPLGVTGVIYSLNTLRSSYPTVDDVTNTDDIWLLNDQNKKKTMDRLREFNRYLNNIFLRQQVSF